MLQNAVNQLNADNVAIMTNRGVVTSTRVKPVLDGLDDVNAVPMEGSC